MSITSVTRLRGDWLCVAIALAASGLASAADSGPQLFLIAATPTNYSPSAYAATLYRIVNKSLDPVRQLATAGDGVYAVIESDGVLSVLSPHVQPDRVEVVHAARPEQPDSVDLNRKGAIVLNSLNGSARSDGSVYELLTSADSPAIQKTVSERILLEGVGNSGSRLRPVEPSAYAGIQIMGLPGGPEFGFTTFVRRAGDTLLLSVGGAEVTIDHCPRNAGLQRGRRSIALIASNGAYRIFAQGRSKEELDANTFADTEDYVHDLRKDTWKHLLIPGNVSRQRLFGVWLATIVQRWAANPGINPGRGDERNYATKDMPDVQREYASFQGRNSRIPGQLIVDIWLTTGGSRSIQARKTVRS